MKIKTIIIMALLISTILISGCSDNQKGMECYREWVYDDSHLVIGGYYQNITINHEKRFMCCIQSIGKGNNAVCID